MSRRPIVAAVCLLLLGGLAAACSSGPKPSPTAAAFLKAWAAGDVGAAAGRTDAPAAAKAGLIAAQRQLDATGVRLTLGTVKANGDRATASFRASWRLRGFASTWDYAGSLALRKPKDTWQVHWQPADVHPHLGPAQKFAVRRTLPERAGILDRTGRPLFSTQETVTVGIEPRRVASLPSLAATLGKVLQVSAADIEAAVQKAKPTEFVPVITLRRADYEQVRPRVHDLAGTVFVTGTRSLGPSPTFAQPLLGRVGEATADVLKENGTNYRAGDELGIAGLQRAFNDQLTGTASGQITVVSTGDTKAAPKPVGKLTGKAGTPVRLTLDVRTQTAADAVLATVHAPAAIVALRPSTGELLAVSNSPGAPFDIALAGQYPAGSTYKIITATAALAGGLVRPDSTVACPGTVTLGGRLVPNEDRFALGNVPLRTAFARSCNTTFGSLAARLPDGALARTAAEFGIGAGWQLPVTSFSGSIPPAASDQAEKAAEGFGQGKVLVSPLAEALMAATVPRGSTPAPVLVSGAPATPKTKPAAPPAAALTTLRTFTRAVVTEGTATVLRGVPGGPVAGKTGTAEFGGSPPQAHSWFTGYQGDLAFAVFVYGGQTGGELANPLAQRFVIRLAG